MHPSSNKPTAKVVPGAGMVPTGQAGEDREIPPQMIEAMQAIAASLSSSAKEQQNAKKQIEDRWHEDYQQFHGKYSDNTEAKLKDANKSRLFVNETRAKTNAWIARLSDMLFPTDDKNWGIKASAVPELAKPPEGQEQMAQDPQAMQKMLAQVKDQASKAARRMESEIEDQLRECRYNVTARDVIDDSVKLGTGVMKGPVANPRPRRYFGLRKDPKTGEQTFQMMEREDVRPTFERVDPWSFFPDMSARSMDEAEFTFQLHLMTKTKLRELARKPGFVAEQIRDLIREDATEGTPEYLNQLRSVTGNDQSAVDNKFQVWEYHGPLEKDHMRILCECNDRQDLTDFLEDGLVSINAVVWFCAGKIIKFGLHAMDSGESLYSVFPFERDDSSIFGYGIPYIMRAPQAALNGAWRMMMDNGDLSVGPQIEINQEIITPADGNWNLKGRKIWLRKSGSPNEPGMNVYDVPSRTGELVGMINLARQFSEDETSMTKLAQGGQDSSQTKTAEGMGLLMNSSNIVFRRVVKNFDDDLTEPCIRRIYHWNMQFSDREDIKGDYEVDARGSSVLLVAEIQAQNLMIFANQFTVHPILGQMIKPYDVAKKLTQSMHLSASDVLKSEDEMKADAEKAAEQGAEQDPEMAKLEHQAKEAEAQRQFDAQEAAQARQHAIQIEHLKQDTELMKLAETHNMTLESLHAKIQDSREARESKERSVAAEIGVKRRMGSGI